MRRYLIGGFLVLLCACSADTPKNYFAPFAPENKVTDADLSDKLEPKVDLLFVIDNSGSMSTHQSNLAANIQQFTNTFLNAAVDYNIGVISTDDGMDSWSNRDQCCGKLVGNVRVVKKSTPRSNLVLRENLTLGINGSGTEKPFATLMQAFQPAMLASHNDGFLRRDATLIVIIITDTEDQSPNLLPTAVLDQLLRLKRNNKRMFMAFGAIIPTNDPYNCTRDGYDRPSKIERFLDEAPNGKSGGGTGDNVVNLCEVNYGQRLAQFASNIVNQASQFIFLSRLPDENSLRVSYGAIDLPRDERTGFSYSPSMNAVILGPDIDWSVQPAGSKVEVHYKEARGSANP